MRLGYLDIADNGARTLEWLARNVEKREKLLRQRNPKMLEPMQLFEQQLCARGLTPETTYLFMHGHTLMDNVVMVLLNSVCEKLRQLSIAKINSSKKQGVALRNELSNYTNRCARYATCSWTTRTTRAARSTNGSSATSNAT